MAKGKKIKRNEMLWTLGLIFAFAIFMFMAQVGILIYFAEQQFESAELAQIVVFSIFGWMIIGAIMSFTSSIFLSVAKMAARKKKKR